MGTGTDVALASADMTLVHGDLSRLVMGIQLSNATMRVISAKPGLGFWLQCGADPSGNPFPAGAVLPAQAPVLAAAAMACFSSWW